MSQILALGDCNTLGIKDNRLNAYPEKIANKLHKGLKNCGYTMSTTREMQYFYNDFFTKETEIILIQYGLVDSWKTFKYAPYVLYYPDSILRKIYRKIVKKYKKVTKNLGLYEVFGSVNAVPAKEYKENIENIILSSPNCMIYLIDTVPSKETFRNEQIQYYNEILDTLADKYPSYIVRVKVYNQFLQNMNDYYIDHIHINDTGHEYISDVVYTHYVNYMKNNG